MNDNFACRQRKIRVFVRTLDSEFGVSSCANVYSENQMNLKQKSQFRKLLDLNTNDSALVLHILLGPVKT